MGELTLESLAARLAELERRMDAQSGIIPASRPLDSVIGMFEGSEFSRQVDAEVAAIREAEPRGDGPEASP